MSCNSRMLKLILCVLNVKMVSKAFTRAKRDKVKVILPPTTEFRRVRSGHSKGDHVAWLRQVTQGLFTVCTTDIS